jgi:transcription termination factor NusB
LEQSALPLDKIYAAEQIGRAEKYINIHPFNENKGYKEQIVELAVSYQINSKYTSFIAVNERDEKLTAIPVWQETVLESPSGWDMSVKSNVTNSSNYSNVRLSTTRRLSKMHADESSSVIDVFFDCFGGDTGLYAGHTKPSKTEPCIFGMLEQKPRSNSIFRKIIDIVIDGLKEDDGKIEPEHKIMFYRIKKCEKMIVRNEAYQTFFDMLLDALKPHFAAPSKEFQKLFKKIKRKTPRFYALIEPYFSHVTINFM